MHSLHTEAAAYLRYVRRFPIVTSEVGAWNADLIGMNSKQVVEVEVKESVSDLRAEFRAKGPKHFTYSTSGSGTSPFTPNYFYVLTRRALKDKAAAILAEKAPYAGLLLAPDFSARRYEVGNLVEVAIKPKKLHPKPPSAIFVRTAVARMSSEICRFRIAVERYAMEHSQAVMREVEAEMGRESPLVVEGNLGALEALAKQLHFLMVGTQIPEGAPLEYVSVWMGHAQRIGFEIEELPHEENI